MKILQEAVSSFKTRIVDYDYPPCFESQEQFQAWSALEAEAPTMPIRQFVCRDCSSCYQKEMTEQNRCLIPSINLKKIAK